jgi:hypothetical protein
MRIILALLILSAEFCLQAQGLVQFQNSITFDTPADRLVYDTPGVPLVGTNYVVGLWYVPGTGHSDLANPTVGTQAGGLGFMRPAGTTLPGTWSNPLSVGNTRVLEGVAPGSFATLQVRIWDIDKYASFAQAFAAGQYGWSIPFDFYAPIGAAGKMEGLRFCNLCPEPSLVTFGFLGAAAVIFGFRRRKK